jgi:hypothetical protein
MPADLRIIKDHVILPVKDPVKFKAAFPTVKVAELGGTYIAALPHNLETVRLVSNLGYHVGLPYGWPGRFKPYRHQIKTTEFLVLNRRAFCLSGMGTCKTASALWATDFLMRQGEVKKTLIVAPLSTLERVWAQEIFQVLPHRKYHVLHGSRTKRFDLLADKKVDFYIINHDGVEIIEKELEGRPDINHVIVDECFPAGTKISTPSGKLPIETIQQNDIIETSWGAAPVTKISKRLAYQLIQLHFEDGTHVECTPEHPFATDRGWLAAKNLIGRICLTEADLPYLRGRVGCSGLPQPETSSLLLQKVQRQGKSNGGNGSRENMRSMWKAVFGPSRAGKISPAKMLFTKLRSKMGMEKQPQNDGRIGKSSEETERSPCVEQGNIWKKIPTQTCFQGGDRSVQTQSSRERNRDDARRGSVSPPLTGGISIQLRNTDETTERKRLSELLQSGLWASGVESSDRGRWNQPQHSDTSGTGSEERRTALGTRVVRIENIESGSPQWVWNFEVAGPHDYIANGVVVHNCATFRNSRCKRSKSIQRIANKQGIARSAWGLTGTPTPNAPTDCYGQIKILTPEKYPYSFMALQMDLMIKVGMFKWVPKRDSAEKVHQLMQPSIRYALEDCLDLPPTIYQEREVELSDEQKKHYEEMKQKAFMEVQGEVITAVNAGVVLNKLLQISLFGSYNGGGKPVEMDFSPRLKVVKEVIEECGEKVIVFVPFTAALNRFYDELKNHWSVAVVDGSVSAGKRNTIFRDFQMGKEPHILLAHPETMAHGLTLTAATTIIWASPTTSTEIFLQANARIARPGQTKTTNIVMLHGSEVERKLYQTLKDRRKLQDLVLDLVKGGGA